MKAPTIPKSRIGPRAPERGVTMVLVALAMVAIIAMAALSIDVISLYLVKMEAQRAADAAALAAARVISISGIDRRSQQLHDFLAADLWRTGSRCDAGCDCDRIAECGGGLDSHHRPRELLRRWRVGAQQLCFVGWRALWCKSAGDSASRTRRRALFLLAHLGKYWKQC